MHRRSEWPQVQLVPIGYLLAEVTTTEDSLASGSNFPFQPLTSQDLTFIDNSSLAIVDGILRLCKQVIFRRCSVGL